MFLIGWYGFFINSDLEGRLFNVNILQDCIIEFSKSATAMIF